MKSNFFKRFLQMHVGGSLSIQDVVPGGGLVPAGTLVRIDGTGFTPATTLQIDGVSVSSTQFVNSREFNFTLGVPTDLTGFEFR